MAHPYTDPAAFPLTNEDADFLRQRLQTDETTLQNARSGRLAIQMQLASRDRVIAALERSIETAKEALGDIPAGDHPITSQGDRMVHAGQWGNIEPAPTKAYDPPVSSGRCASCKEPLWPTADGLGVVHTYGGADCFPDRDDTTQAQLEEAAR